MVQIHYQRVAVDEHLDPLLDLSVLDTPADAFLIEVIPEVFETDDSSVFCGLDSLLKRKVPAFILSGQHAGDTQTRARAIEAKLINQGAVSLGACGAQEAYEGIQEYLSNESDVAQGARKIRDELHKPVVQPEEVESLKSFLIDGSRAELGKYAYARYRLWQEIKKHPAYSPISKAAEQSFTALAGSIIREMRRHEITDYFSMGPTPSVDAHVLGKFVEAKQPVIYHPIDISAKALDETREAVVSTLDASGDDWRTYVVLVDAAPQTFQSVKPLRPALLAYPGGQLSNNPEFLEQAMNYCREGSLVAADVHMRHKPHDALFWEDRYDVEPAREMFTDCITNLVPDLKNHDGWEVAICYLVDNPNKISARLRLHRDLTVDFVGEMVHMDRHIPREMMISRKYTRDELAQTLQRYDLKDIGDWSEKIDVAVDNQYHTVTSIIMGARQ